MKKTIMLSESEIIKLIKRIIVESTIPDLKIEQFSPVPNGNGYELKDMGKSIDYIGKNSKQKNNPKIEFILKFYKKPENEKYKVECIAPDYENNDIGAGVVSLLDDAIIKEFKKPQNGGIDFGSSEKSVASPYGNTIYYVEYNELETFKTIVINFMKKYGF